MLICNAENAKHLGLFWSFTECSTFILSLNSKRLNKTRYNHDRKYFTFETDLTYSLPRGPGGLICPTEPGISP